MKNREARLPCTHVLSSPPRVVNGALAPLPCRTIGNAASVFWKSLGPNRLFVPGKRRIEIVHQILRKDVRVSRRKRVERLRGNRVEERVDGIGVGGLQAGVGLKAKPGRVLLIDVVVDAHRLHLLVVVAGMRNALPVGAAISVRQACPRAALPSALNGQPSTARGVPPVFPYSENIFR